jgi:hypothetical protein
MTQDVAPVNHCMPYSVYQNRAPALRFVDTYSSEHSRPSPLRPAGFPLIVFVLFPLGHQTHGPTPSPWNLRPDQAGAPSAGWRVWTIMFSPVQPARRAGGCRAAWPRSCALRESPRRARWLQRVTRRDPFRADSSGGGLDYGVTFLAADVDPAVPARWGGNLVMPLQSRLNGSGGHAVREQPATPPISPPHRADMGNPASARTGTIQRGRRKGCWARGRSGQLASSHSGPLTERARWQAAGGPRNPGGHLFRSKTVRRTQRRSGGLQDSLEGRAPDDEAPAKQTPPPPSPIRTPAWQPPFDGRRLEEPFSVYVTGETPRLRFPKPDLQNLNYGK